MAKPKPTAASPYDVAGQRIEENAANKREFLDLGDLALERLPVSIAKLGHLRVLALGKVAVRRSDQEFSWQWVYDRSAACLVDLAPLRGLTGLTSLNLNECEAVCDLEPLRGLTGLTDLDLSWCEAVRDLEPLRGLTGLTSLDLTGCKGVCELEPLRGLTGLRSLNLAGCRAVCELEPLRGLTGLTDLDLSYCNGVSELEPLRGLTCLDSLNLAGCTRVRKFTSIQELMDNLERLILFDCHFDDLPAHLCGEQRDENVAELVRRHYAAQDSQGGGQDAECKLLVLGNGGAGKTSLVRLILGEPHRVDERSTHAIHLGAWYTDILLEGNAAPAPVRVNVWDFGGQDLYHETHRLFFQTGAVYALVWDPWEAERTDQDAGSWYTDKKHRLQYWVDQVTSVDPLARILVVRNKADLDGDRPDPDWHKVLPRHQEAIRDRRIQFIRLSAGDRSPAWKAARRKLFTWIAGAVATVLGGPAKRAVGKGRLKVKEIVRRCQMENDNAVRANESAGPARQPLPRPFVTRAEFDQLVYEHCAGSPDAGDTTPVLEWLDRTGVVFWNKELFGDRILVDQRWAIQGIYTLLDREHTHQFLSMACGHFTGEDLSRWAWEATGYTAEEQQLFLTFMQSCGLCFLLLGEDEVPDGRPVYVAPEYLPTSDHEQVGRARRELRRGLDERPDVEVSAAHPLLGEGVLVAMINGVGATWSRSAVLWQWGVAYAAGEAKQRAVAEVTWSPAPGARGDFGGVLHVAVWGAEASTFLPRVLRTIGRLPGFPREATFSLCSDDPQMDALGARASAQSKGTMIEGDSPEPERRAPSRSVAVGRKVWFSAAAPQDVQRSEARLKVSLRWEAKLRAALVVNLMARSVTASYSLIYSDSDPSGARMPGFARHDLALVLLTDPYLLSEFQMSDLVQIYELGGRRGIPKDMARCWRLPSAGRHLTCGEQGERAVSKEFKEYWKQKLAEFDRRVTAAVGDLTGARAGAQKYDRAKRNEPNWRLFEFIADDAGWSTLLTALANHEFEASPLDQGTRSAKELNAFAEKVADDIHRLMASNEPADELTPAAVAETGPEGLARMGDEARNLSGQLMTFLYAGLVLRRRKTNSMKAGSLVKDCVSWYGITITTKTLSVRMRRLKTFFEDYYARFYPGKIYEFFDLAQGRPHEILKDGWDVWWETRHYLKLLGHRVPNE
jgi:hypothetical protein